MDGTKISGGAGFQQPIHQMNGQTKSEAQNQRLDEINSTIDSMLKDAGKLKKVDIDAFYDESENIRENAVDFDTNIRAREMMEKLTTIERTKGPSFLDKLSGSLSRSFSVMVKSFQPISNYFSKKHDEAAATTKEYHSFSNPGDEEAIKAAKEAAEKMKNNQL